jgi:hypothetical protein
MNKQEIIQAIGTDTYSALQTWVSENLSEQYGMVDMPGGRQEAALQQINDLIWGAPDLVDFQRVELFCQFYHDLPVLTFPYYVAENYAALSPYARAIFWDFAREQLDQPNHGRSLALLQSITLDFSEDPACFEDAWAELTGPRASEMVLVKLLEFAGSVPFELKVPVYERLLSNTTWHQAICWNLVSSLEFDEAGSAQVLPIMERLRLPPDDKAMVQLREALRKR